MKLRERTEKSLPMSPEQRLQVVLYLLIRDQVPSGILAKYANEVDIVEQAGGAEFCAEGIAAYAEELAHRILGGEGR